MASCIRSHLLTYELTLGEHNLTADYDSTLSCSPDMKFEKDTARKVTMHFTGSVSTYYRSFKVDASNALEVFKDEAKVNSWTPQQLWETLKRNGGGSDAQPKPEGLWRSEIPYCLSSASCNIDLPLTPCHHLQLAR